LADAKNHVACHTNNRIHEDAIVSGDSDNFSKGYEDFYSE